MPLDTTGMVGGLLLLERVATRARRQRSPTTASTKANKHGVVNNNLWKSLEPHPDCCLDLERKDVVDVAQLLVDHQSEHTHLGGTALVELDVVLTGLLRIRESVPAEVDVSIAEVTRALSANPVPHEGGLQQTNEEEKLGKSGLGDSRQVGEATREVGELGAREVNVAREAVTSGGGDVTNNTEHGNTSVLQLDVSEAVEFGLIGVLEEAERVVEADRGGDSDLAVERVEGGRGLGSLGRSKGSGAGDEGGNDSGLHGRRMCALLRLLQSLNRKLEVYLSST